MAIARKIINTITQRTINFINSGFSGNPFYLTNPESFFKDIVKFEVRNLVDIYAYNKNKFPFGKDFALNTINAYQKQLEDNTAYSLSKVINDPVYLESYRNNFNVGGWNGFLINTQYPQNNYIGFTMLATEDLARKLDGTTTTAAGKVQDTLEKSAGFLAPQTCATNPKYNNGKNEFLQPKFDHKKFADSWVPPFETNGDSTEYELAAVSAEYDKALKEAKALWEKDNTCPGGLKTTTPGSILGSQIEESLKSKGRQAELAAAVGNSLGLIFDTLMAKLFDTAKGLISQTDKSPNAANPAGVQSPPNNTGYSGGGAEICTDIQVAGGGGGRDAEGNPIDIGIDAAGTNCTTITPPVGSYPTYPGTTGSTPTNPTNPPTGGPCTGNNPKCTCAEGVASYEVYASAVATAENIAYPNGLPSGTSPTAAQAAVCAAYAGPGSCRPAGQEDELIIEGLPAPYVTVSIDFLAGNPYYLWSHPVAACEAGVQ